MITPFHAIVPVPGDQALNALADREFLAEAVPEVRFDADGGGDLLRGVFTAEGPASVSGFQVGLRLVDFDSDDRVLRYEAQIRQVGGRGVASLTVDMALESAGGADALVLNSRLAAAGIDGYSHDAVERAVSAGLSEFGTRVVDLLGENPGRIWRAPGATSGRNPASFVEDLQVATSAVDPTIKRVVAVLGTFGGAALSIYLLRRAVRAGRVGGARA